MEDDDEFGDLYTDVLRPFATLSESQPHDDMAAGISATAAADATKPTTMKAASAATTFRESGQIDLNNIDSDDEEIIGGASNSNSNSNSNVKRNDNNSDNSFMQRETLAFRPGLEKQSGSNNGDSDWVPNKDVKRSVHGLAGGGVERSGELGIGVRSFDKIEDGAAKESRFGASNFMDEDDINVIVEEGDDKGNDLVVKDENLVVKNGSPGNLVPSDQNFENLGGEEDEPMIPGVSSIPGVYGGVGGTGDAGFYEEDDSDSEDDLQIVLNNDDELGLIGMDRMGGIGGEEDDDEDGNPLVIVSDNDNIGHQPMMEGQEWGEDKGAGMEGERRESGDAGKVNGGVAVPPKLPYGNHAYHHPFHSQFKYVRPGAAPMPGGAAASPGGVPGQVRPPVNVGPAAGRGRGDWRPAVKGGPLLQKGFHPGYGMPVWGSNASGRGLEFTLPSHKTIFEVDIDSFEEKPWKLPGADISDFFNFGLNEESWKNYCKQLEQQRLEATMQSRIRVYESGRTEQEYDPDLPPELAAASGLQDVSAENANVVKIDSAPNESSRGSARVRPPLPTGRPIQVETNYTDRQPSIDTRQPRIRDSDAIIEIVCQDSADEGSPENDMVEQQGHVISKEDLRGADGIAKLTQENTEQIDDTLHADNTSNKDFAGRRGHSIDPSDKLLDRNESFPSHSESSMHRHPSTREQTPIYSGRNSGIAIEERRIKGRTSDRSPKKATTEIARDKRLVETQNEEESYESINGKQSSPSSSAISADAAREDDIENKVTVPDESVQADKSSNMETISIDLDMTPKDKVVNDEKIIYSPEIQKSGSQVDQPSQDIDEEDSKAARSSENSKARSASSKDNKNSYDGVDEEVIQGGRAAHVGSKRSIDRDEALIRRKGHDGRLEPERPHTSVKGMDESDSRKGWEPNPTNSLRAKTESIDRRRESDYSERGLHRNDEDLHGRRARVEDSKKRAHADEIGSRHRNKVRESERSEKDERHQLREPLDNGNRRGNYEKDVGPKHRERDDSLKRRYDNADYLHSKRRKEDAFWRREQAEKEEILHGHRESSSSRKKERDDVSDQWKRDEPARLRDDDIYIARHKEEVMLQRERGERHRDHDEWHRAKHAREEIIPKRDREEARSGLKGQRAAEEKMWSGHSRGKEEYKGYERDYHPKDIGRQSEQHKRRDRLENEIVTQQKGRDDGHVRSTQHSSDERRARHERASTRDDRSATEADNHKVHEKKHKEYPRKGKELEAGNQNSLALSRKNADEQSGQTSELASSKGKNGQSSENEVQKNHQLTKKHNEEASSDDEQMLSRRGRSKLERWTSHKEREFSMSTGKSSSSLQIKEVEAYNSTGPSSGSKLHGEVSKTVDKQPPPVRNKDIAEINNEDGKLVNNKHLDTVEKLKKRSERFKLPLPSEKEATATKKIENEPRASGQSEIQPDTEIKPERPARKRRWTSNS